MKFGLGREKREEGNGQHATSQKSKKQLLRSWTFFQKKKTYVLRCFHPKKSSEEQKKQLLIFFGWTVSGSGDPNFQQSADCGELGSLDRMAAATSRFFPVVIFLDTSSRFLLKAKESTGHVLAVSVH